MTKKILKFLVYFMLMLMLPSGSPSGQNDGLFTISVEAASTKKQLSTPVLSGIEAVNGGIRLKWKKVRGAQLYRVYRKEKGSWKSLGDVSSVYFVDRSAVNRKTYYYTVRCVSRNGKSYTSSFDHTGVCITYKKVYVKSQKPKSKKLNIAVASGGASSSIVKALKNVGVNATVVGKNASAANYDGLVLPGGGDVNPSRYGEKNKASSGINNAADDIQFTLTKKFVKARKPILGICRGAQVLNVYFGGSLNQNIGGHGAVHLKDSIVPGTRIASVYGSSVSGYCTHHQSVKTLGSNLVISMRSSDGSVEGFEHMTLPVIAVQWHPEKMGSTGLKLFRYYVKLCRYKY